MKGSADREQLEQLERQAREPEPDEPEIPFARPAILALQRAAGNQAVARFLQRQPNLTVTDRQGEASERVLTWFVALRRTGPCSQHITIAAVLQGRTSGGHRSRYSECRVTRYR